MIDSVKVGATFHLFHGHVIDFVAQLNRLHLQKLGASKAVDEVVRLKRSLCDIFDI